MGDNPAAIQIDSLTIMVPQYHGNRLYVVAAAVLEIPVFVEDHDVDKSPKEALRALEGSRRH
jgi:hypothetical protein